MSKGPQPPVHLTTATRAWWRGIVDEYQLESHHIKLLTAAATALDRAEQAREIIDREGLCVPTKEGGMKAHPAVAIEHNARLLFVKVLRELGLDVDENTRGPGRPPHSLLYSNGGRRVEEN